MSWLPLPLDKGSRFEKDWTSLYKQASNDLITVITFLMGHSLAYTYYITFQHRYIDRKMFKDEEILTLNFVGSIQCDQMLKNNSPIFPKSCQKSSFNQRVVFYEIAQVSP